MTTSPSLGKTKTSLSVGDITLGKVKIQDNTGANIADVDSSGALKIVGGVSGTVTANLGTIADVATQTTLAQIKAKTDNLDVALSTRTKPGDTQTISGNVGVSGSVTANAGTNLNTSALALETGGNLASIKTNTDKIPSQGQALAGASMPVVLPAAQISTLTPLSSVTVTQGTGSNLHTVVDSGSVTVSGTVTANNPTASNFKVDLSGTGANSTAIKVDGSAVTQPVSGTFWQATQPVSASALPLPTGAATSAKQDTTNGLLGGVAGLLPVAYDYITLTQNATQDIWVFKTGGSGGTTVATITITYTDSTKATISTVAKT